MGINASTNYKLRITERALHFVCCFCANADVSCFGMSDIRLCTSHFVLRTWATALDCARAPALGCARAPALGCARAPGLSLRAVASAPLGHHACVVRVKPRTIHTRNAIGGRAKPRPIVVPLLLAKSCAVTVLRTLYFVIGHLPLAFSLS
jgi:hypothetical protein